MSGGNSEPETEPDEASEAEQLARKRGLPPGTPVYTGDEPTSASTLTVTHYDEKGCRESVQDTAIACFPLASTGVTWLDVVGLHDLTTIQVIAEHLHIHPLAVEDALNVSTLPKVEDFGELVFVVASMVDVAPDREAEEERPGEPREPRAASGSLGGEGIDIRREQLSIVMGRGFVLTLQERPGDVFDALRRRIRAGTGRIRKRAADYLLHAILDSIVDAYFVVLQRVEGTVLTLEDDAIRGEVDDLPRRLHALRVELHSLRRAIAPLQTAAADLVRSDSALFDKRTVPFFRDLQDHVRQALDILGTANDRLRGVMELQLAQASHRTNEVMSLLTLVATVFIPLTFVAGIYGMNFVWMPELEWPWGYPAVLLAMLVMAAGMGLWFRRRRWL